MENCSGRCEVLFIQRNCPWDSYLPRHHHASVSAGAGAGAAADIGSNQATSVAVTAFLIMLVGTQPLFAADRGESCPDFPPVIAVTGTQFYSDAKGSVSDPALVRDNEATQKPILDFLFAVENALDRYHTAAKLNCAEKEMSDWARAGALAAPPADRQGGVERIQYVLALDVIAVKFVAAGKAPSPPVMLWLRDLNHQIIRTFEKYGKQGNLTSWSAAGAAIFALLDHDSISLTYQDKVWRLALATIDTKGYVATELARGQRALIYHQFSLSALLVLRAARVALGQSPTPPQDAALRRLATMVGHALCDPARLAADAGATQEMPGDWGFRVAVSFAQGLLGDEWAKCALHPTAVWSTKQGGDLARAANAISSWHGVN